MSGLTGSIDVDMSGNLVIAEKVAEWPACAGPIHFLQYDSETPFYPGSIQYECVLSKSLSCHNAYFHISAGRCTVMTDELCRAAVSTLMLVASQKHCSLSNRMYLQLGRDSWRMMLKINVYAAAHAGGFLRDLASVDRTRTPWVRHCMPSLAELSIRAPSGCTVDRPTLNTAVQLCPSRHQCGLPAMIAEL